MAFTLEFLQASTSGQLISVGATSSPGTIIHSGVAGTSQKDEVYLYANNTGATSVLLTVQFANLTPPINQTILPQEGMILVCPGLPINNSAPVRAYAATSGWIQIGGHVLRGP
jgi:hypothetical protein